MTARLFANRYELLAQIGAGGFGKVFRARDSQTDQVVALKILPAPVLEPEKRELFLSSFKNEFKVLTLLHHPNVCRVFDYGHDDVGGDYFFTTELVDGTDILKATEGLFIDQIQEIFIQICRALEYIHSHGVVHYDIKPDNILVTTTSGSPQAKVVDFGLARGKMESRQFTAGTVRYMAPEVIVGAKQADYRSDLYALGIILYELIARRYPFAETDQRSLLKAHMSEIPKPISPDRPDIPAWWDDLILKLIAKSPAQRFSRANFIIKFVNLQQEKQYALETKATLKSYTFSGELIARDEILDRLKDKVDFTLGAMAAAREEPAAPSMLLIGEAGTGKSRLLSEIKYYCQLGQIPVSVVSSDAEFWKLFDGKELEAVSGADREEMDTTSGPAGSRTDEDASAKMAAKFFATLPPAGLVLMADNLAQWDRASQKILAKMIRQTALQEFQGQKSRLLIYGAWQGGADEPFPKILFDERVLSIETVANFTKDETENYLKTFTGLEVIPKGWFEGLWKTTSGNPLFLEEVLKSLIDSGSLFDRTGLKINDKVPIPSSVRQIAERRLVAISPFSQAVAHVLASGERSWGPQELSDLLGHPLVEVIDGLNELQKGGLARAEGDQWMLKGNLFADVIVNRFDAKERTRRHAQIGQYLEATGKGEVDELALHFWEAKDQRQGVTYLTSAARIAEGRFQFARAISFYEKVLDLIGQGHPDWENTVRRLARLAALLGDYEKARRFFSELAAGAGNVGAYGLRGLGWLAFKKGELGQATHYYEQGLATLKSLHDPYAVVLMNDIGSVHLVRGEIDKAIAIYQESSQHLETLATWEPVYLYGNQLGVALSRAGQGAQALAWQQQKLEKSRAARDHHSEIVALSELGYIHVTAGDLEAAVRCYEESLQASEEVGYLHNVVKVLNNIISILQRGAGYQKALAYLEKSLDYAQKIGTVADVGQSHLTAASLYTAIGVHAQARIHLDKAEAIFRRIGHSVMLGWTSLTWGYFFENQDRVGEATSYFSEALAYAEKNKLPDLSGYAALGIALMAMVERDFEQVRRFIGKARSTVKSGASHELDYRIDLLAMRLDIEWHGVLKNEARGLRERFVTSPPAGFSPEERIEMMQVIGNSWIAEGDNQQGLKALEAAKGAVDEILKGLDEEYRESFLKQRRIREIFQDLKAAQTQSRLT